MKLLCLATLLSCALAVCPAGETNGILFLHLKLQDNRVSLVKQSAAPGVLKARRGEARGGGLEMELRSMEGQTLWKAVISDPGVRRLEFEDPEVPGRIRNKDIIVTNAEFTVRVPAHPQGGSVSFARRTGRNRQNKMFAREELGEIRLQPVGPQP